MLEKEYLNDELRKIKNIAYDHCSLVISEFKNEIEGKSYKACQFNLNDFRIICRTAKITPKKIGQFVTLWKRNEKGITTAYQETDPIDFCIINVKKENRTGQFIFPKLVLIDKGIISTIKKEGKRGFRIYPIWDSINNEQAERTQKWQLDYFVEYDNKTDLEFVKELFERK